MIGLHGFDFYYEITFEEILSIIKSQTNFFVRKTSIPQSIEYPFLESLVSLSTKINSSEKSL